MKPIPVLGIPHYNRPDLTARCIESIDYPVDLLVLVNNGPDDLHASILYSLLKKQALIRKQVILRHPNAGVAGSWNEVVKLFPAAWWLISNNDIQFAPGDLEKMVAAVHQEWLPGHPAPQFFYGNHGASWFALTAGCLNAVGLWDENFYPAYDEDCDYAYRMKLLGVATLTVPDLASRHGDEALTGSCTIHSDISLRAQNGGTHGRNHEYYRTKWGGDIGAEKFTAPYGMPQFPIWCWHYDPFFRRANQWV